jgi:hypothetical protein
MRPSWLFETDLFDTNVRHIVHEVEKQGMTAKTIQYVPLQSGQTYKDIFGPGACVVFYGSLGFADQIRRETAWIPGTYGNQDSFRCTHYYPALGHFLLAEEYAMVPYGDLVRQGSSLYEKFGSNDAIFMRPDSGGKSFTGQVIYKETFEKDVQHLGFYDLKPEELVVVSPPRNIKAEWRFAVVDGKVITGSQYQRDGKKDVTRLCAVGETVAWAVAQQVAIRYQPARVWTVDICQTVSGHFRLLEIGCLGCAGWYACNIEDIVREVSRVAREEWTNQWEVKYKKYD